MIIARTAQSDTITPMAIYFARHGLTDWNNEKRIQGSVDIELNEEGRE